MMANRIRPRRGPARAWLAGALLFAAILAERNRLARGIHDTLARGLAATTVPLRLARKSLLNGSEQLAQRLDIAQSLVSESLDQARQSIWNVRSQVLETGDLATALGGIITQLCANTGTETRIEVTGAALFICEDTVTAHFRTLFVKLGAQDPTEAAINAIRHGIVHLD